MPINESFRILYAIEDGTVRNHLWMGTVRCERQWTGEVMPFSGSHSHWLREERFVSPRGGPVPPSVVTAGVGAVVVLTRGMLLLHPPSVTQAPCRTLEQKHKAAETAL